LQAALRRGGIIKGRSAVRLARRDDLPHIADIERSAGERFRGTHMDWAADAEPTGLDELEPALARGELWVADLGGGPVGFLLAYPLDDTLYVREVSVRRDQQGNGLGRQLIEAAQACARANGHRAVTLTTDELIEWNRPLYERLGFRMLDAGELSPALAAKLADERKRMPPSARRCAMRLDL
jgi:GNAT superfamily N-acetyltransferase